uniref:Uncharacterized protein n=1 Tax=viral metagenome TaxID=1070528 RepID=A0A6C0AD96_9ZZZZ
MNEGNLTWGIIFLILGIIILVMSVLIQVQVITFEDSENEINPDAWYWYLLDVIGVVFIIVGIILFATMQKYGMPFEILSKPFEFSDDDIVAGDKTLE